MDRGKGGQPRRQRLRQQQVDQQKQWQQCALGKVEIDKERQRERIETSLEKSKYLQIMVDST